MAPTRLGALAASAPGPRRPDRGLHDPGLRRTRCAGPPAGVDSGRALPRHRLSGRRVPRRHRPGRVAVGPARGARTARGRARRRRTPDRGGAVAAFGAGRHDRLGAGRVRVQARHRPTRGRVGGARPVRRPLPVHGRAGGAGRARDDVAGLQRLGRLQPLPRSGRRPSCVGGELRPPVSRAGLRPDAVRRAAGRGHRGACAASAGVPDQPRPAHLAGDPARGPRLRVDGARRVLDATHAPNGRSRPRRRGEPGLSRRQHDVLADPARRRWDRSSGGRRVPLRRAPGPGHRPAPAHGTVPCRARRPGGRARADGDGLRVLPRRRAVPRGVARMVGLRRHGRPPRRLLRPPGRRRGRPRLSRPVDAAAAAGALPHDVLVRRRPDVGAVGLLQRGERGRCLQRRHAALDLRAGRPVLAVPPRRAHPTVRAQG